MSSILENLVLSLPELKNHHVPGSGVYNLLKLVARGEIEKLFDNDSQEPQEFGPFGSLTFPYHKMGAVDSLNLFDIDELIIFSFYWINRNRYRRVVDIGANIGLHSIILGKCGFEVRSYEPDPGHFAILQRNLSMNNCSNVRTTNAAVSSKAGVLEFIRVLGNTTGSHLAGSKSNPYGELEKFPVQVESIEPLIAWGDLLKIDAEGHEKEILLATKREHWLHTDALVEVGSEDNAQCLFNHFEGLGVNLFSQKSGWKLVHAVHDMPVSHHEGTLFVTFRGEVPWV